jgi:hypothetical protein
MCVLFFPCDLFGRGRVHYFFSCACYLRTTSPFVWAISLWVVQDLFLVCTDIVIVLEVVLGSTDY